MYLNTGLTLKMVLEQILDSGSMILENSSRTSHLTLRSLIAAKPAELSCLFWVQASHVAPKGSCIYGSFLGLSHLMCSPHALLHVAHASLSSYTSREWKSISVPIRQVISLMEYQKGTEANVTASQAARSSSKTCVLYPASKPNEENCSLIHQFYLSGLSEF